MPKVHYCESIYKDPIQDINPLILQAYPGKDILVICAREGQQTRLNQTPGIVVASWWKPEAFDDEDKLLGFDIVVILDRDRIDSRFAKMLAWVEQVIQSNCYASC